MRDTNLPLREVPRQEGGRAAHQGEGHSIRARLGRAREGSQLGNRQSGRVFSLVPNCSGKLREARREGDWVDCSLP